MSEDWRDYTLTVTLPTTEIAAFAKARIAHQVWIKQQPGPRPDTLSVTATLADPQQPDKHEHAAVTFPVCFLPRDEVGRFWFWLGGILMEITVPAGAADWPELVRRMRARNAALGIEEPKNQATPSTVMRGDYFKASGRLMDTPRVAASQGKLADIGRWYEQTGLNRRVAMAAAALTQATTREAALGIQRATIAEIEDLVYWREDGTPAHGQHHEDILWAFEALRALPVPIVKVEWQQVGTNRRKRFRKVYKLGIGQLIQTYWPIWRHRATGELVYAETPPHDKHVIERKPDRRKRMRELVEANAAVGLRSQFPADCYELEAIEWRWNTDIANDYICPQSASTPRKRRHEGSRFVMVHRRYFAVQKHLAAMHLVYAQRLFDLIISEKSHIKSRRGRAVWVEIQAEKVVKWLGLWEEYQKRPKHVLEEHLQRAIQALIAEGVMLPRSDELPRQPTNRDRRKTDVYCWKVAELWSTVALVQPEEVQIIQAEQLELPGIPRPDIPSGAAVRAAREAAGINLREFARRMGGPDFSTWSRYEAGKHIRVGAITPEVWKRVGEFIATATA